MLKPAILALIRQVLTVAGTALVAKGYVQASDIEPAMGALLTIGSVVWSVTDKRGFWSCCRKPMARRAHCWLARYSLHFEQTAFVGVVRLPMLGMSEVERHYSISRQIFDR